MSELPADRPHYAGGTPVPDFIDNSTREWSRGVDPQTGIKGAEPTEPAPTVTSLSPTTGSTAGGTVVTVTGTEMGGSTGLTIGGVACTSFSVLSETQCRGTTGAHAAGAVSVVVANPAGNSSGGPQFTYA